MMRLKTPKPPKLYIHHSKVNPKKPSDRIMKLRFSQKAKILSTKTGFTEMEIEGLLRMYEKICDKYEGPMTKTVFKDVLFNFFGLSVDLLMDKVFRILKPGNQNYLSYDEWILAMHIFIRSSFLEKVYFVFSVYDYPQKGYLKKEDIQGYLKDCLVIKCPEDDPDEYNQDLVEYTLKLFDHDKDGMISQKDFVETVILHPLLMEVFGDCLPNSTSIQAFEVLFKESDQENVSFIYQQNPLLLRHIRKRLK